MIFSKTVLESIAVDLPESIITSDEIESDLSPIYESLKLPAGRLKLMTGIRERRYWKEAIKPSDAAAAACKKVFEKTNIDPKDIDLLIFTSVCRDQLEPSTASSVHAKLGLTAKTHFFDLSNACLGFVDAMAVAASMIDMGGIKSALICSGENGYPLLQNTVNILKTKDLNRKTIKPYFANLTIGSAATAAILTHESLAKNDSPRLTHASQLTDSTANHLCEGSSDYGDNYFMQTDSEALMGHGIELARNNFDQFLNKTNWTHNCAEHFVCHQVGKRHQGALYEALNLNFEKDYSTYPTLGNTGSASLPVTLCLGLESGAIAPQAKTALLGIGSGLASTMIALNGN